MKISGVLSSAAFGFASFVSAISVSYDPGYDDGSRLLASVTCSDGRNGLITKYGWNEQGDIPVFPMIGGYQGITKWNSSTCGTCYSLAYNGVSIYVLAIDFAASGFNIAKEAMDVLTLGRAETLGRINAQYVQVNVSKCKIGSDIG